MGIFNKLKESFFFKSTSSVQYQLKQLKKIDRKRLSDDLNEKLDKEIKLTNLGIQDENAIEFDIYEKQNMRRYDMNDNLQFLSDKVSELGIITKQLLKKFPEKSFTLDGILIGNIIELMVSEIYGITLYKQSEKVYDGYLGDKQIQIKGTQRNGVIVIRHEPKYLLVVFLDIDNGEIQEIYNGLGKPVWDKCKYVTSMNHYTINVSQLLELNKNSIPETRIKNILPIKTYNKTLNINLHNSKKYDVSKNIDSNKGKTTKTGYINKNRQENLGCLNKQGTHMNQLAYKMKCHNCNNEYEANGCDIFLRKCPFCM